MSAILLLMVGDCLAQKEVGKIPVMNGMQVWSVGEQLTHQGHTMRLQGFTYAGGPEVVLNHYQLLWEKSTVKGWPGYIREQSAEWQILSRVEEGLLYLVQVKYNRAGQSEGYLSVRDLSSLLAAAGEVPEFPAMSGSTQLSVTESFDFGREAKTYVLTNNQSVDANQQFYISAAQQQGWRVVKQARYMDAEVIMLNSPEGALEIAMKQSNHGDTIIFVNLVSSTR